MTVSISPRSKAKTAISKLSCRNSIFVAIALIVFEVGFMTGRVGRHDVGVPFRGLFYNPLNISDMKRVQPLHDPSPKSSEMLPRPLKSGFSLSRTSPNAEFHRRHAWSQPLVMAAYMRFSAGDADSMDVLLITTGVSMGTFRRNFTAAGCMIGSHVYPVKNFLFDRTVCKIPKTIEKGAFITLVLFKDDVVKDALNGPVTIGKEFVARLEKGDLRALKPGTKLHGGLRDLNLGELVSVNSRAVYDEQLDPHSSEEYKTLPRYEICLATQIKPATYLLPDWVDYHRRLGVDYVYIFDNHADEDISALLSHRSDVEVVYWPWEKSQIQAFTYAIYALRARCEWVFLMDTDEYVMVGLDGAEDLSKRELPPLKRYVREKERVGFAQIWFHWVIMKNSEYLERPEEPVPEAYIHREDPQLVGNEEVTLGKTMVSMNYEWLASNAHSKQPGEKTRVFNDFSGGLYPRNWNDTGMIVHYRRRSWVEYQEKINSGRANINNPRTVSLLKHWDSKGKEEYRDTYMRYQAANRKVYTHFRNIWRRVSDEMDVGTCVTRRRRKGRWCRTFYDLREGKGGFENAEGEVCEK